MADSPRWCEICKAYGDHHTDKHPAQEEVTALFIETWGLNPDGTPPDLHPDLEPYLYEEDSGIVMLKHPLVYSIFHHEQMNGQVNKQYEAKMEAIQQAVLESRWESYIWLHERPYRIEAFDNIQHRLDDKSYWSFLSQIWIDTENMWQNAEDWEFLLSSPRPGRKEHFMEEDDVKKLDTLDPQFTVFRGTCYGLPLGLSWTLDKEKAAWFALRFRRDTPPIVVRGTVAKDDVIAYLGGRGENEIVTLPDQVTKIRKRLV